MGIIQTIPRSAYCYSIAVGSAEQPRFSFSGVGETLSILQTFKGRKSRLFLLCRDNSVQEPNAQPTPATGLFKGVWVLSQQAEKQTSGVAARCLFRVFVYTNALQSSVPNLQP